MQVSSVCKIINVHLRHNFAPHLLLALVITILTTVVFGISSLSARESAQPLEMLLSLTGVILITPIFAPEQNENIRDLIRSKRTDYLSVCFIRLLCSLFFLALIFGAFTVYMYHCECKVTFRHFLGGFSSALFLGALGFFFAGISRNTVIGYMIAMIYYIANFAMKDDLKKLYIFSMSSGSFNEKYWLLGIAAAIFAAVFILPKVRHIAKAR